MEGGSEASIGRFVHDERGSTAIEYGLICALVFLGALAGMTSFGEQLMAMFGFIEATITKTLQ